MKKILTAFILLAGLSVTTTYAADIVRVRTTETPNPFIPGTVVKRVVIQSLENNLTITGVSINRGNCDIAFFHGKPPVRVNYGQEFIVSVNPRCHPAEIHVDTSIGSEDFSTQQ
ncbi:hypothetical protein [Buttiauxella izardii]|uniref:Uncharacterized protein n=1 Tax=Buttiauxella izardii TaxID=82991 RepID=A0A3A5JL37_9ENTR|nr:hypothetical protein [Buttiauxella izardii]RJT19520.1 hypothetical protein D6029_18580 [Buttiauxella izardii]